MYKNLNSPLIFVSKNVIVFGLTERLFDTFCKPEINISFVCQVENHLLKNSHYTVATEQ